ncbi:hypothetical protein FA13DRAFT_1796604 [Coprinellus micaceus]|uniref:Uncharacterized protein n=1 Tax=Coprinellus micaceus TaxID=71717 RepID=A0A4Y7STD7_COPMI|nr:hypothetical protein FA13DRAFT_1796604 [Coprinellus micaceus]
MQWDTLDRHVHDFGSGLEAIQEATGGDSMEGTRKSLVIVMAVHTQPPWVLRPSARPSSSLSTPTFTAVSTTPAPMRLRATCLLALALCQVAVASNIPRQDSSTTTSTSAATTPPPTSTTTTTTSSSSSSSTTTTTSETTPTETTESTAKHHLHNQHAAAGDDPLQPKPPSARDLHIPDHRG